MQGMQGKTAMHNKKRLFLGWIVSASALTLVLGAGLSSAATRGMVGSLGIQDPSVKAPFLFEGGPAVAGKKQGVFAPTVGYQTVQVAGTATGTAVGRPVTLGAGKLNWAGKKFRTFMGFPNVAQTTKSFMTVQQSAMFANGNGALAACPGPGCTGAGAGTAISFCPPLAHNGANPAPGITAAPVGNWDCNIYNNPGAGNRAGRIAISNDPTAPHFGGTLLVLRNAISNVWRRPVAPSTPNASDAQVERSWMSAMNHAWTPGRPNFEFTPNPGNHGPIIRARMGPNNAVVATFGCANGVGTIGVGKTFMGVGGGPIAGLGGPTPGACGTAPGADAPGQGWGFKMTTGTISGSDVGPKFSSKTALGTPFAPGFVTPPVKPGFFFTRMGDDSVVGTVRNIVLLGGSVTVDPNSGNIFNRVSSLRLRLQVPEPAGVAGLLVGLGALAGIARRRR